ncbi:S8 family serine peptidase [Campylobacter sp.]|uniref:S8 family serine peptidase n=1 Tax=Campylobacter sp. TaxID=205 RepID=UPI0026FDF1AD|nr:S8 family serine peptidase [Campylobacter sp.]
MSKKRSLRLSKVAISALILPVLSAWAGSDNYGYLQRSHEMINLPNAYNQNPTIRGNGITVGILDSYFYTDHPSLKGKDIGISNNFEHELGDKRRQEKLRHGSHVTGIILGKNTNRPNTPHGVAYDAKYYGVGYTSEKTYTGSIYNEFKDKDISIINNSWASTVYPLINRRFDESNQLVTIGTDQMDYAKLNEINKSMADLDGRSYATGDLVKLAKEKKTLIVFASGNSRIESPQSNAVVPSYDKSVKSWIVVGSIASQDTIIQDENGGKKLTFKSGKCSTLDGRAKYDCESFSGFSNAFKGATHYAILAPGQRIDSANAYYNSPKIQYDPEGKERAEFYNMSGTSMAAPMVSGAAALVKQKFSSLNGADIANIILSTANKNYTFSNIAVLKTVGGARIFYIDREIPMNGQDIDIERVKHDLIDDLGYNEEDINKLFNGGIFNREPIIKITKDEMFGQGILDVAKALKGLAVLDANRLDINDIKEFNGARQAFYTLDTNGEDVKFENDISQKLWQEGTHLANALNTPETFMKTAQKVGFMKVGEGDLTLSGSNNSYEGDTVVKQGGLNLIGELTQSNAWAVEKGILNLQNGSKIHKNANAQSGGVINLNGGVIENNAILHKDGKMFVNSQSNIKGRVEILNGGYAELKNSTLVTPNLSINGGIFAGSGSIQGNVANDGGILKAGFVDKNPNVSVLQIIGQYSQDEQASLEIGFNPQNQNSGINATSYDIRGGNLVYAPAYEPGSNSLFKEGDKINIDKSKFANLPTDNLAISVKDSNIFKFKLADDYTINVEMKENPFNDNAINKDPEISSFDKALKDIVKVVGDPNFANSPIGQKYSAFFVNLDTMNAREFKDAVDSIEGKDSAYDAKDYVWAQNKTVLNNINFMLTPASFIALPSEPLASLHSDLTDRVVHDLLKQNDTDTQISVNSNYSKLKHDNYDSDTLSTALQAKKMIDKNVLGGFIDFASSKSNYKYSNTKQKRVSAGIGGLVDIGNDFLLITQGNLGVGFNDSKRRILGLTHELRADYKSYLLSAQVGVARNFTLGDLSVKPVALLGYSGVFQEKYKESGGLFAKSYDKTRYDNLSSSIGIHFVYQIPVSDYTRLNLDSFGYYTMRLNGDNVKSRTYFNDFPDQSFEQKANVGKNSVYYGINAELIHKRYFTRLGLSNQRGKDYSQINVLFSAGMQF